MDSVPNKGGQLAMYVHGARGPRGQGHLTVEAARSQPECRDLYLTAHDTHNRHPCPQRDSNPQSYQTTGCKPTPYSSWQMDSFHNNGCVYASWLCMVNASWINHAQYSVLIQTSGSTRISNTTQFGMWRGRWNSILINNTVFLLSSKRLAYIDSKHYLHFTLHSYR